MVVALIFLGGLGAAAALLLGIASRVFFVEEDPRIGDVENALPGANCGGCGYAGCRACAEAIVAGEAEANVCVAGGFETAVEVAAVMGVKVEAKEPEIATTTCTFGTEEADLIYRYSGAQDCQAAVALFGGSKLCPVGCIGLGSCVKACQFDALTIGEDNLPHFNPNNCVACGACAKACPKGIIQMTSSSRRIVEEYTTDMCTAPCQRACPTGIDIPRYIAAIREGLPEAALRIIKEKCPLPLICGRICPAPCELDCRRNLAGDEAVAINPLKRYVADYEMATGRHVQPYQNAATGRKAAVIGAGAAGLTASYYLARLGHETTLFESRGQLGGILRHVISPGRLPDGVLDHEIKGILDMGVEARTSMALGRDMTIGSLIADGYDAVLLCTGGYDSRKILNGGERLAQVPGVMMMVDAVAAGGELKVGARVAIAGATDGALELARACRKSGAQAVMIAMTTPAEKLPKDWPAAAALKGEGIELRPRTTVAGFFGTGDQLVGVTFEQASGNGAGPGVEIADLDTLILATGRYPELAITPVRTQPREDEDPEQFTPESYPALATAPTWKTVPLHCTFPGGGVAGILSTPEPGRISDASAVVRAMLSGRRVVRGVHQALRDEAIEPIANLAAEADEILNVHEIDGVPVVSRQEPGGTLREPSTPADWTAAEEAPGLDERQAREEAHRCLQCGLICYKKAM